MIHTECDYWSQLLAFDELEDGAMSHVMRWGFVQRWYLLIEKQNTCKEQFGSVIKGDRKEGCQ
jgi:hypothetical protein